MKKAAVLLVGALVFQTAAMAQSRTANGLSDAERLAISAGAAQACGADNNKLVNYEVIVSRILVNPTATEQEETAVLTEYAQKKFEVFNEQKKAPEMGCAEVVRRFENLPIFKSVVYRDGTIKLPDGKVIKPKRPVDIPQGVDQGATANNQAAPVQESAPAVDSVPAPAEPKPAMRKPFRPGVIRNNLK